MSDNNLLTANGNVVSRSKTRELVQISVLAVLAFIIMQLELVIPIFPSFLKMDLSDLPAIIAAVAIGPLAGVFVELIKNVLHFVIQTRTVVGELANFLVGSALLIPLGLCYRKWPKPGGYALGSVLGVALMAVVACLANYYFLIPFYASVMGVPISMFVEMAHAVNASVVDFQTFIFLAIAPFNILKGIVVTILGFFLHKLVSPVL